METCSLQLLMRRCCLQERERNDIAQICFVIKRSCSESDVITRYGTPRIESTGAVVEVISSTVAVILALDHI